MLCGDFNARTSNENDYIENDSVNFICDSSFYDEDNFVKKRNSKDRVVNSWGYKLLSLCKTFNIHFLNGRSPNDEKGEYTFIGPNGLKCC